jgi:hypothetical protein
MRTLKLALLGTGIAARQLYWPELLRLKKRIEVVACCNRTKAKAQAFAADCNIGLVTDTAEELFALPHVDAVLISLPIAAQPKVSDVWKIGDRVKVRVKDVDREAGKISLSHRPFSEDITAPEAPAPHHGDGGRGGFDRPRGGYDRGPRHHGGDRHERPPMRPDQPTQPFQPLDRMTPEPRQDLDV